MDLKLKDPDYWYSLHGQVPGLLDWDMENEFFLTCTTDQSRSAEDSLARYKIRVVKPPEMPQQRNPIPVEDDPDFVPNMWVWVNPNIVCPLGNRQTPQSQQNPKSQQIPQSQQNPRSQQNPKTKHTPIPSTGNKKRKV